MKNLLKAALGLSLIVGAANANAATAPGYAGIHLGLQSVSEDIGSQFAWGARVGYHLAPEFGLGVVYTRGSSSKDVLGTSIDYSISFLGLEGFYRFVGTSVDGLYLGADLGIGMVSVESVSASAFTFGPKAGYDYALDAAFSLGFELSYHMYGETDSMVSFTALDALVTGKYWF